MKFVIFTFLAFLITGCASGPKYNIPPKQIEYSQLSSFWVPEESVSLKNLKIISSPKMGCNAIYAPESGIKSDRNIQVRFTIDSTGKQYDQEVISASDNVEIEMVRWALTFGLSPTYSFEPAPTNISAQPIVSTKTLYLTHNGDLCSGIKRNIPLYSDQSITITNRDYYSK